jgi:hypothetical protein
MNDLEWNDLENLKQFGVQSISVDRSCCDSITSLSGDEFGALRIPSGPNYNIELSVDSTGLKRLQEALKATPRKPEDELKHELNVMHKVNEFEGVNVSEKIDKFFDHVDSKMKNNRPAVDNRYKIKHK